MESLTHAVVCVSGPFQFLTFGLVFCRRVIQQSTVTLPFKIMVRGILWVLNTPGFMVGYKDRFGCELHDGTNRLRYS
jgi:hypothetical protein